MTRQQQALAQQQRELERQAHQVERAHAMAMRGRPQPEQPPISEDELIELMLEIAQNDSDPEVREAAFGAIGLMGSDKAMDALIALYDSLQDPRLQRALIASIGIFSEPTDGAITKLREIAITSGNPELQQAAVGTLANTAGDRGVDALLDIYDASIEIDETDLKKSVIHALGMSGNSRAFEKLKEIAGSDPEASLRLEAVRSLAHLGSVHDFMARPVLPMQPVEPVEPVEPFDLLEPTPPVPPVPDKRN